MDISPELRAALQKLRAVRSEKPPGERSTEAFAAWREKIAEALDVLALVLIFASDRDKAVVEAKAARAEAAHIRRELNKPPPSIGEP
ncbi:hypothetical protein ACIBG4_20030 [Nonomuraea sp. NPDC050383]|uniref:hypothetical protein n=1 Tax=Nonomuraea sp. NPDC050383 TaxID=3364362 RepID=UPI0037B33E8F